MPWKHVSMMDQRREFVSLAQSGVVSVSELSRRFGISRDTAHRLLRRHASEGDAGLFDRSRRPLASPFRTPAAMEARVLGLRTEHPVWGGRKIARRLRDLGMEGVPSASTITEILRRHGRLDEARAAAHRPFLRFEHAGAERALADGLQGPLRNPGRALPSAHRDRRPQPLCSRARRLRRGDGRHGARPPHRAVPPLRPARDDARRQRPALGQRRPPGALYRASRSGCCASAWTSCTAGRATPRPRARTNASTAP